MLFAGATPASRANSSAGVMNEEEPQSRQTISLGNTRTPGLSASLRPGKWMFTSAGNSARLVEVQNVHDMVITSKFATTLHGAKARCLCRINQFREIIVVPGSPPTRQSPVDQHSGTPAAGCYRAVNRLKLTPDGKLVRRVTQDRPC